MLSKLDVEKAYNHVNWDFLIYMLECCGFMKNGEGGFLFASLLLNSLFLLMKILVVSLKALKV